MIHCKSGRRPKRKPPFRLSRWALCVLLCHAGPSRSSDLDLTSFLLRDQQFEVGFPARTDSYYRAMMSTSLTGLAWPVIEIALGSNTAQSISVELPTLPLLFVRVDEIARSTPLDSDSDGLDDLYELSHAALLDPLNPDDAGADADGDNLTALREKTLGTDPGNPDTDGDTMPDGWEANHNLNPLADDAEDDPDDDELDNLGEYEANTDPHNRDTDSDGLTDGWEEEHEFNPLSDGGIAQGLAVRWTLDEGSGGSVRFKTLATPWTGVLRYMVASNWVDGLGGKALWFDGINDYVSVSQADGLIVTGAPFTVMATVWRDAGGTNPYPTVISDGKFITGFMWPGFILQYQQAANSLIGFVGNSNVTTYGLALNNWSPSMDGRWVNVALTHDGTRARLFVDGAQKDSFAAAFHPAGNLELRIGGGHANAADAYWKGRIDDVRIYRAALGSNELGQVNDWIGDADGDGLTNGEEYEAGTDPRAADSDGDHLTDYEELRTHGTDPLQADSDGDGMPDDWELANQQNPLSNDPSLDPDTDGLTNLQEYQAGTDPRDADTDDDGLSDGDELTVHLTNPLQADTDSDGLPDGWEIGHGTNANAHDAADDPDSDGLTNLQEYGRGTEPQQADTDADGMPDGWEVNQYFNPLVANGSTDADSDGLTNLQEYQAGTDPRDADTDDDGLSDYQEAAIHHTNPLDPDTDDDTLPDAWEAGTGLDPLSDAGLNGADGDPDSDTLTNLQEYLLGTHPMNNDTDSDNLTDSAELNLHGTDPRVADTDSDGLPDGWELQYGFNPLSGIEAREQLACWLKFDEASGTTLVNSASAEWRATARGMPGSSRTNGVRGGALVFDGLDDYVAIVQTNLPIVGGPGFTIAAWVWYDPAQPKDFATVCSDSRWVGDKWPGFLVRADKTSRRFSGLVGNSTDASREVGLAEWPDRYAGRWTHVALVQDNGLTRLLINGCIVGEQSNRFESAARPEVWLGQGHVSSTNSGWKGRLDEVRIYTTALSTEDIHALFEAEADANGDGISNLEAARAGLDPRSPTASPAVEGALDITFVPGAWTTNDPLQYLAFFDDPNPSHEIHLFVERDTLEFTMYDAGGARHSIRHRDLLGGGHLWLHQTNRITASWRGFNSGADTLEMRLFLNGVERNLTLGTRVNNPRLTMYNWEQGDGYYQAAYIRGEWSAAVPSNRVWFGSRESGAHPLNATIVRGRLHTDAFGMVSTNPTPSFSEIDKTAPAAGRPQALLQSITRPGDIGDYIGPEEMTVLIRRYKQVADAVECEMAWLGEGDQSPSTWDILEDNIRTTIEVGNQEGLDVALSSWFHFDSKICRKYTNSIPQWAERIQIIPEGDVGRAVLAPVNWMHDGKYMATTFDVGDRATVSNFLAAWRQDLSMYSDYSYFLFNEDSLQWVGDPYTDSPTYSSNALAWFREYTTAKYGPAYASIRFPISPIPVRAPDETNPPSYSRVTLDDSVTNRLELSIDPDLWAKWWEWRYVVFAHLMEGYTRQLAELNSGNYRWKGSIYLASPSVGWALNSGVDLRLLARIPHLDWIVMENTRTYSYGTSPSRTEDEIRLQLQYVKDLASTNLGFGSYVMAQAYPYPTVTNGVTNFTYNITWLTQDVAHAASTSFNAQIVVPYSASVLVNRPGFTSEFQHATYVPEVAEAWLRERFLRLWTPISSLYPNGGTATYASVFFSWSYIDQSQGYEWQLSTSPDFAVTNVEAQAYSSYHGWSILSDPMPTGQALYWRVRSVFHVYRYSDEGAVTGTNVYYGAWSSDTNAPLYLQDDDLDGLPDAWEMYYFNSLIWEGDDDPDGDLVPNSEEYLDSTYPGGSGSIGP